MATVYRGLDKPKSAAWYIGWKIVFVLMVLSFIGFVWAASASVDYTWRWNRVPQYFWFNQSMDIASEAQGTIVSVSNNGTETLIDFKDDDGTEYRQIVTEKNAEYLLTEGDYAYTGDRLATYEVSRPGVLLEGLAITLEVSVMAIVLGIALGLLTGLCRISENPALKWSAITYIELIRGSPLMVQIFLWYFVAGTLINEILQHVGMGPVPPMAFGVLALAIFTGAYVAEIVRAGIQSVSRGQMEAARSLGLNYSQAMRKVILPQAFRRIMPPLAGQFISLIKDSSLLGVIAIRELTKATREIVSSSLQAFELWIICAILYLVLTFALSLMVSYLENKAVR